MNIFLPYENDIEKSVQALDDKRLNKQALEAYQLLQNALKERNGEGVKGYKNHPIYVHYKENIRFLLAYGYHCCAEWQYRFHKVHNLLQPFMYYIVQFGINIDYVSYEPFYMEGTKGQPNYIRTKENVSALYQKKLCGKWDNDKANGRPPKWTNRETPSFYKEKENGRN